MLDGHIARKCKMQSRIGGILDLVSDFVLNFGIGMNAIFDIFGGRHKDRFAFEIIKPINQNKNGLQMKDDITIQIGFKKSL